MHSLRLGRLFNPRSGRALDVAVDHGFFGEPAFLTGIENIRGAIGTLVDAQPDAIQLTLGQARHLAAYATRERPALVLRADVANVYGNPLDETLFSHHLPTAVEDAVRFDAVAICVNLMQIPKHPEIREANIRSILALRSEATKLGMPLMIEPLVMQDNSVAGGYMVDGDVEKIAALVRQAVELGADLIKADPSDDLGEYGKVIEVAGDIPVLVRGGGRVDDRTLLERTRAVLDAGAAGIVYGRNIVQHRRPRQITRALLHLVHDDATVDAAERALQETEPEA